MKDTVSLAICIELSRVACDQETGKKMEDGSSLAQGIHITSLSRYSTLI